MKIYSFLISVFLSCGIAFSQKADLDKIFSWTAALSGAQATQGSSIFIDLTLTVTPEHFTYRERTSFSVEASEGIRAAEPIYPQPESNKDPTDGEIKAVYVGTVKYRIPLAIAGNAPLGKSALKVTAKYQGCSQTLCYFPQQKTFPLELEITKGTGVAASVASVGTPAATSTPNRTPNEVEAWLARGTWAAFFLVFAAGFLTSFTPCVYPLIPITVTIFGAREVKSQWQGFLLAATYVLGMAVMYSALGFAAARSGAVFGQVMSNPWIIGGVAVLFAAMGASMLGAFELQLPSSWQTRLSTVGGRGFGSAFLMGLVGGIIAAPCTGPVLAAILAYVAVSGNPFFGFSLLFVFSLGLGVLFMVIGTFSGAIARLPKSGRWMESVKSVFGILLFAFALYFLKDVVRMLRAPLSFSVGTYVGVLFFFLVGCALGGIHLSFHASDRGQKARKSAGVVLCTVALYVGIGSMTAVKASELNWDPDLSHGLSVARAEKKPALIDFSADWCVVCKEIEAFTFSKPEVQRALRRFVLIRVDLTDADAKNAKIQDEYRIAGLPLIVFQDSQGTSLPNKRITGFISTEQLLNHITDIQ